MRKGRVYIGLGKREPSGKARTANQKSSLSKPPFFLFFPSIELNVKGH